MTEHRVSARYAQALIDAATQEGQMEKVHEDFLHVLTNINESKDFRLFLKSPVINHWHKKRIFTEIFEASISKLTLSFLILLAEKKREILIESIIQNFFDLYDKQNNRLKVGISSSIELNDVVRASVIEKLTKNTGMKIIPTYSVDKNLIGGIQIKISDWVFDASVRNQLEQLRIKLATEDIAS